jgi:hypothetical protein
MQNLEELPIEIENAKNEEPKISHEIHKPETMNTKKARIQEKIKEMITDSTIHALPNIYKTEKIYFKLMWFSFFLITFIFSIRYIYKTVTDYLLYETVTQISIGIDQPAPFPTVSFQFQYGFSSANYTLEGNIIKLYFGNIIKKNLSELIERITRNSLVGEYYKFNSGKDINGNEVDFIYQKKVGYLGGLTAEVFIGRPNEFKSSNLPQTHTSFFSMYIHNKSLNPVESSDEPIKLTPGLSTELKISRVFTERLPYPYNDCIDDLSLLNSHDSLLVKHILTKTSSSYRQKDCFDLCQTQYIIQSCNLTSSPLGFPWELDFGNFSTKIYFDCAAKEYGNFINKNINEYCKLDCPLECNSIEFNIDVITSSFPNENYAKELMNNSIIKSKYPAGYNITLEDLSKSLVQFSVYYKNFDYTLVSQTPKQELVDCVSNFGGLLGLFVGMSFLSFGELIEALIEVLIILFEKNKVKNQK